MKAFIALILVVAFGLALARAWDYEQSRYSKLETRLVQLEVHDCGLTQYEDLSIEFQRDDDMRFACAALMRGSPAGGTELDTP
jgi:hypothetical protein